MTKRNVLVMPCGSEIGLELYRSLGYSLHFKIFGGSSVDDHGKFVYENYIGDIPFVDDPLFIQKMNDVVEAHNIEFIFPAHDSVVLKLAQAKADGSLKCEVVTSPVETCEVARSKLKSYQVLDGIIPTPGIFANPEALDEADYPIFLKPDVGQGTKGTYLAKTAEDVAFYTQKDPSLLLLEYLPGKEYTVDCFTDRHGELRLAEARERRRISNGISVNSGSINDDRIGRLAAAINQKLVFRGAWFFQVKESSTGELVLLEIAPRIAGTMGLIRCRGVDLALLSLFDAMEYDVDVFANSYEMVIDRALQNSYQHNLQYGHVYLDFDDLVLFEGRVNPQVMAFVYQCVNKGIKIHLLTKHKDDLHQTLERHKLTGVFDDIIWLKEAANEKQQYIKHQDAIFIDDSFAERKAVHDAHHIPVFDAHMIEGLMEKF